MYEITRVNLDNLNRCEQVWDDMPQKGNNRVCMKCRNQIIDFRHMDMKQIAEIHAFTPGRVCGLYSKKQLNNGKNKREPLWKGASLVAGLLTLTAINSGKTQEVVKDSIELDQTGAEMLASKSDSLTESSRVNYDSLIIYGEIKMPNGEPAMFASVLINGSRSGVMSDINGKYSINVRESISDDYEINLRFAYIGFEDIDTMLNLGSVREKYKMDVNFTKETIMADFIVSRAPLHKRLWNGIKRFFRKKK